MNSSQKSLDLKLWLDSDLIQRQNQLKSQFQAIFEGIGNSFSEEDFKKISSMSRGVKLTRGNDLFGYPYQVLDLIRDFDPENGVNIRILNWFGNGLYLTILLGKNRKNPAPELLSNGYFFGLSENQWDYPDLILNKNTTDSEREITKQKLGFFHWIKEIEPKENAVDLQVNLANEAKKIIDILDLS
jgi:hypothetical protein